MLKFRYQVINKENKQLSGVISAPDEKSARNELKELGFAVLSIEEAKDMEEVNTVTDKKLPLFEFSAIDKNKKKVGGSIQSVDRISAYRRLLSEYNLEVEYIVDASLSAEEKLNEKKKGVYDLQMEIEEELTKTQKQTVDEKELQEFTEKQAILKLQIEFVLKKVKEMLDLYEHIMKPETKENIRRQVEKILRIKNSTNLEYVKKTAEELLTFLQQEEIYFNEESLTRERTKMLIEAKSMMMQLRKGKSKVNLSLSEKLRQWRTNHQHEKLTFSEKIINVVISLIIGTAPETLEVMKCREEIANANTQLQQYMRLYFQSTTTDMKIETKEALKKLWQERKKMKKRLKTLQQEARENSEKKGQESPFTLIRKELVTFSGYLLCLYLIYYFVSLYLSTKELNIIPPSIVINVFQSTFIKYLIPTLFIIHGTLAIKTYFLEKTRWASLVLGPVSALLIIIIYLNF